MAHQETPFQDTPHGHPHHHEGTGHQHSHGTIDPSIVTTQRGLWAVKWSFIGLLFTALIQAVIVWMSGSVALLADTIHNVGDAVTALPLGIAFVLARRPPSPRFTYGLGRAEDLAGVVIVGLIAVSALVAGYESLARLFHPQPLTHLGALAAAAIMGFVGNEAVALFRIRVGKEIGSAALVADGYHARADGLTSLAVLGGAVGVWLGYPIVDPAHWFADYRGDRPYCLGVQRHDIRASARWRRSGGHRGDHARGAAHPGGPGGHAGARQVAGTPAACGTQYDRPS